MYILPNHTHLDCDYSSRHGSQSSKYSLGILTLCLLHGWPQVAEDQILDDILDHCDNHSGKAPTADRVSRCEMQKECLPSYRASLCTRQQVSNCKGNLAIDIAPSSLHTSEVTHWKLIQLNNTSTQAHLPLRQVHRSSVDYTAL